MQTISLWPDGADGQTLTVYPAEKPTGGAIVICPGGGYGMLADHEGEPVARWLNTLGITGIVLKYRLGPAHRHPAMLDDAAQAVRTVRAHAGEWKIDPKRVGILGFSAGGHLASTLATHFEQSSRPDLAVLIYPVISLNAPHGHLGSRVNLLGEDADPELVNFLSNETQVTPETPPTFLVHTADDAGVPVENSLLFAAALRAANVPFELHVYETGPHGFGLGGDHSVLKSWPDRCAVWLQSHGF